MHAILITPDNIEKIDARLPEGHQVNVVMYYGLRSQWYVILDYVTLHGVYHEVTVLPAFMVEAAFIIDVEAASKDWDTIYRLG